MTMTHKEALILADSAYWSDETVTTAECMEAAIRAYIEARGLDLVPKVATAEMKAAGESWSALPGQTWEDMLDASPDPFSEE